MLATLCVMCLSGGISYLDWLDYGQPSAALWKDQLFVAVNSKPFRAPGFLYRGTFSTSGGRFRSPVEHYNPNGGGKPSTQAKINIRDDRLLTNTGSGSFHIFPMHVLPELEANDFGTKLSGSRDRGMSILPHAAEFERLVFPPHRKADVPLSDTDKDDGDIPCVETYLRHAHWDAQIAEEKSVWLFHKYKDKIFVSVERDCLSNWYLDRNGKVAKDLPEPPDRHLRTGKLPSDFADKFASYTSAGHGYLVTPNGKLYIAVAKGEKELEVTKVWDDPKRRIVGVVQDSANDAMYGWGFATTSAAPGRFYVKLDPKPVAVDYKLTVPLWNDRSDAYLECYECARAFRKAAEKK